MKCFVSRCPEYAPTPKPTVGPREVALPFCQAHRKRYQRAYLRRFNGKSHFGEEGKFAAWVATWVQMVDAELLNAGNGGGERGKWVGEKWVPEGSEPVKSSYHRPTTKPYQLPEHATRAGQQAIAQREKLASAIAAQVNADAEEYKSGRRMELELEWKMRRAEQIREAALKLPQTMKAAKA